MIKVKGIDHVAIAVADEAASASQLGSLFGLLATPVERVHAQQADVVFLHAQGDPEGSAVELVCSAGNASLDRFLAKKGPGLHHICFEVDDLAASLAALKASGVPLIDETPRLGARGHLVAFLHPRAGGGVLFELCEKRVHQARLPSASDSAPDAVFKGETT